MNRITVFLNKARKLLMFIKNLDWYAFSFYSRIIRHHVELSITYQDELGLSPELVVWSSSSGGPSLAYVLRKLAINCTDSIIDIGCGKGGALITLSDFQFGKIAGVELSYKLVCVAKENLEKLKIKGIETFCCNATEFNGYDEFNYIYMYNPFPDKIMIYFLQVLQASLQRKPRELIIIYKCPACHDLLIRSHMFKLLTILEVYGEHPFYIYKSAAIAPCHR
jgi:SAM-dependent methyltransferase